MGVKWNVGYIRPCKSLKGEDIKGYFVAHYYSIDWYGQYTKGFRYKFTAKLYAKILNYLYNKFFLCQIDVDKWTWNQYNMCCLCEKVKSHV